MYCEYCGIGAPAIGPCVADKEGHHKFIQGKFREWFRFDGLICVAQGRLKLTDGVVELGGVIVGVISEWLICIFLGEFTLIDKST